MGVTVAKTGDGSFRVYSNMRVKFFFFSFVKNVSTELFLFSIFSIFLLLNTLQYTKVAAWSKKSLFSLVAKVPW